MGVTTYTDSHDQFPGASGPYATTEADPDDVGRVRTEYAPDHDGDPDPGEIVWTWVPFEEMGRRADVRAGSAHN
jgi:hypothetical protein